MQFITLQKEPQFAEILTFLMKEYKISGQKIADKIGKSQKTISRYARGEGDKEPKKEVQKKILQAIADIKGYDLDQVTEDAYGATKKWNVPLLSVEEAKKKSRVKQRKEAENDVVLCFRALPEEKQKFVLQHLDIYAELKLYEMEMMDNFNAISEPKRKIIMEVAEYLAMKEKDATGDELELCRILQFAEFCEQVEKLDWEPEDPTKCQIGGIIMEDEEDLYAPTELIKTDLEEQLTEKLESEDLELGQIQRLAIRLIDMVNYTWEDWEFLKHVRVIHMQDDGRNYTCDYQPIGDEVYMLACWLEKVAEKESRISYGQRIWQEIEKFNEE